MHLRSPLLLGAIALTLALLFALVASAWSPEAPSLPTDQAQVRAALQRVPLLVIQNVGQFAPQARFQVRGGLGGGALWLAEDALWLTLVKPASPQPPSPQAWGEGRAPSPLPQRGRGGGGEGFPPLPQPGRGAGGEGVHLRLRFLGANPHPRLEPFRRLETHVSYFLGNDPTKWRADVPVWGGVRYVDLYPGIDLEVVAPPGLRLIVHPGAHLGQVRLVVEGAEGVAIEGEQVHLDTAVGRVSLPPLLAGEGRPLQPTLVEGAIVWARQPVDPLRSLFESVSVPGAPATLLYSTFLGGNDYDYGYAIALDGAGAAYVTGRTGSSNFPTTPGAFDPSYNGNWDAFVTKLLADGSGLVYSTFLGGIGSDWGNAIALDGAGAATVTGWTWSTDFPTTPGAFDPTCGCDPTNFIDDAFVAKLNSMGTALVYSTFLGGSGDDMGWGIAVDAGGAATVTGWTGSPDFPITPGAFDPSHNGGWDAFVTRLNAAGSALVYSTFLGGSGGDGGNAIALDGAGAATVTGWTWSTDFPTTPGAFDPTCGCDPTNFIGDAFVARLNASGSGLVYSTFLGGSGDDGGWGIALDAGGAAYVTGGTWSPDFPTTPGAFDPTCGGCPSYADAFVTRLNASGTGLAYSTFLGGSGNDGGAAIALDGAGAAYVMGSTESPDFPTTPGAFDPSYNGNWDAFVTRLNAAGSALVYSTFLGGSGVDEGHAIALDGAGAATVTGYTYSSDFPTTSGAFDPSHNGYWDAFVTRLRLEAATPTPTPTRTPGVSIVKLNLPYGSVQPGERISYTIHYSNVGGVPLSGIVITDAIPVNTVLDPAWLQPPATVQAGVIRWQPLPTVMPGGSNRVAFAVVLPTLTPTPGLGAWGQRAEAGPPTPGEAQALLQGCPPGVQVCNVAWIYTTQTNRWQASNPAFNPSTRLYLPLMLKGP